MTAHRVCLLLNPAAGRGRSAQLSPAVGRAFAAVGVTDVRTTRGPGDEARLTREAINDGCDTIAALGGDGTWSKVADAIVRSGAQCRLALVAAGTGNDFAKSVGAPTSGFSTMARLAAEGPDILVDVGRVDGDRHFLNVIGFGFDATVLATTSEDAVLRGRLLYARAALQHLFRYRGTPLGVDCAVDEPLQPHLVLAIANGRHYGGAFRIAPDARLDDGLLDAVLIRNATPMRRLRLFAAALRGGHVRCGEVSIVRAAGFTLRFEEPPAYQADGELRQAESSTVDVSCVPRALRVVTAKTSTIA